MPSQITSTLASKAPAGERCALELERVGKEEKKEVVMMVLEEKEEEDVIRKQAPIETSVIKLNNFAQWASSGSVVP